MLDFYDNLVMKRQRTYADNKLDGVEREWTGKGIQTEEIPYENGKIHGVARYWQAMGPRNANTGMSMASAKATVQTTTTTACRLSEASTNTRSCTVSSPVGIRRRQSL